MKYGGEGWQPIEHRLVEIDAGTLELIPWDDARSELFGESEWGK